MKVDRDKVLAVVTEHLIEKVPIADLIEAIIALTCKARSCENEARYTSGYCGICDILHNQGNGERR